MDGRVYLSFSFMNRRVISTNPYLGGTANGYPHPSGTALHYDDVPCVNGSVSVRAWAHGAASKDPAGSAPLVSVQV